MSATCLCVLCVCSYNPANFVNWAGHTYAFGADPYDAPWTDTCQVCYYAAWRRGFEVRSLLFVPAEVNVACFFLLFFPLAHSQFNYWNMDARAALTEVLMGIAAVADMARVDMAMLMLNDVIEKTWGQ